MIAPFLMVLTALAQPQPTTTTSPSRHNLILVPRGVSPSATTAYLAELCKWAAKHPEIADRLATIYVATDISTDINQALTSLIQDRPAADSVGTQELQETAVRLREEALRVRDQRLRLPTCYRSEQNVSATDATIIIAESVHLSGAHGDALSYRRISTAKTMPPKWGYVPFLNQDLATVVRLLAATALEGIGVPVSRIESTVIPYGGTGCARSPNSADICVSETTIVQLSLVARDSPYQSAQGVKLPTLSDLHVNGISLREPSKAFVLAEDLGARSDDARGVAKFGLRFLEPGLYVIDFKARTTVSDSEDLVDIYSWRIEVLGSGIICDIDRDCLMGTSVEYRVPSSLFVGVFGALLPSLDGHPTVRSDALIEKLRTLRTVPASMFGDFVAAIREDLHALPIQGHSVVPLKEWVTRAAVRDLFVSATSCGTDSDALCFLHDRAIGWCSQMFRRLLGGAAADWRYQKSYHGCFESVTRRIGELVGMLKLQAPPAELSIDVLTSPDPFETEGDGPLVLVNPPSVMTAAKPEDVRLAADFRASMRLDRKAINIALVEPKTDSPAEGLIDIWPIPPLHTLMTIGAELGYGYVSSPTGYEPGKYRVGLLAGWQLYMPLDAFVLRGEGRLGLLDIGAAAMGGVNLLALIGYLNGLPQRDLYGGEFTILFGPSVGFAGRGYVVGFAIRKMSDGVVMGVDVRQASLLRDAEAYTFMSASATIGIAF